MNKTFILIAAVAAIYFINKSGGVNSVLLTTDQKRRSIISWWQTTAPPLDQQNDNGRFIDIISSISPAEIDTIYLYLTNYVEKNITLSPNDPLYNSIQYISNQYNIFS